MRGLIYFLYFTGEKDSFSLGKCFRFDDESASFSFWFILEICSQIMIFDGKHPSEGKKRIAVGKFLSHFHEITSHKIFPGKIEHPWKMIDFFMLLHSK